MMPTMTAPNGDGIVRSGSAPGLLKFLSYWFGIFWVTTMAKGKLSLPIYLPGAGLSALRITRDFSRMNYDYFAGEHSLVEGLAADSMTFITRHHCRYSCRRRLAIPYLKQTLSNGRGFVPAHVHRLYRWV